MTNQSDLTFVSDSPSKIIRRGRELEQRLAQEDIKHDIKTNPSTIYGAWGVVWSSYFVGYGLYVAKMVAFSSSQSYEFMNAHFSELSLAAILITVGLVELLLSVCALYLKSIRFVLFVQLLSITTFAVLAGLFEASGNVTTANFNYTWLAIFHFLGLAHSAWIGR